MSLLGNPALDVGGTHFACNLHSCGVSWGALLAALCLSILGLSAAEEVLRRFPQPSQVSRCGTVHMLDEMSCSWSAACKHPVHLQPSQVHFLCLCLQSLQEGIPWPACPACSTNAAAWQQHLLTASVLWQSASSAPCSRGGHMLHCLRASCWICTQIQQCPACLGCAQSSGFV